MAIAKLTVWPFVNVPNFEGGADSLTTVNNNAGWALVGAGTYDACLNADDDGKFCRATPASTYPLTFFFDNNGPNGPIPAGSIINSIKFQIRIRNDGQILLHSNNEPLYGLGAYGTFINVDIDLTTAPSDPISSNPFSFTTYETSTLFVNPVTTLHWQLEDLFPNLPNGADLNTLGALFTFTLVVSGVSADIDSCYLVVDWSTGLGPQTYPLDITLAAHAGMLSGGSGGSFAGIAGAASILVPGAGPGAQPGLGLPPGQPLVGVGTSPGTPAQNPNFGNFNSGNQEGNASDLNQWRLERVDLRYRQEEHKG